MIDKNASEEQGIFRRDRYFNAAVLIPFVEKGGQWHILLQKRAQGIRQGGEISFPGGGYEDSDGSFKETAIRETVEEIGIPRENIRVYGKLNTYIGRSGLIIEPYIGELMLEGVDQLEPDVTEVEALIYVPLQYFLDHDPKVYHIEASQSSYSTRKQDRGRVLLPVEVLGLPMGYDGTWGRFLYEIYVYEYEEHTIWGLTADMLYEIAKRIRESELGR